MHESVSVNMSNRCHQHTPSNQESLFLQLNVLLSGQKIQKEHASFLNCCTADMRLIDQNLL